MSLNLFAYGDEDVESAPKRVEASSLKVNETKVESGLYIWMKMCRRREGECAKGESSQDRKILGGEDSGGKRSTESIQIK